MLTALPRTRRPTNQPEFKATFKHFPDIARSMHPIHFPSLDVNGDLVVTDSEVMEDAVTGGFYLLGISPDQAEYKNRFAPIALKTQYCAGRLKAQECSGRGLCDHATGLCTCFEGYMTEDCSEPEELS
jgi:hypothetical protein